MKAVASNLLGMVFKQEKTKNRSVPGKPMNAGKKKKGENEMKFVNHLFWSFALILGTAGPAFSATGRVDHSGLFVWAFIGLCAVIVAAQAIPAIVMMVGTARAVAKKVKEEQAVPAESKVQKN